MLEKFTKDEIKQFKKELKELGPDSDTKYFKLKNAREALRCSGIPNYYQIEMALYKICDFTFGNYSQQLTTEGYKPNPEYIETKSKRVQLLVQPSVYEAVKAKAKANGISTNEAINEALREYTDRNAGHIYHTRRNKEIKTNVDKYKALFTHLVNMIINYYDKEAVKEAERKY